MIKVKLVIITNPILLNAKKLEYLIFNIHRGIGSIDKNKYQFDLHIILWNSLDVHHYYHQIFNEDSSGNFFDFFEPYIERARTNIEEDYVQKIIKKSQDNISRYPKMSDVGEINSITYEFEKLAGGYSATRQFQTISKDVEKSTDYDLYFAISSNLKFANNSDYLHKWIITYEKYPSLPLYLNHCVWLHGDNYPDDQIDKNTEIKDDTNLVLNIGPGSIVSLRPSYFVNFLQNTLFKDKILQYTKENVKIHIGSILQDLEFIDGNGNFVRTGEGIKINNVFPIGERENTRRIKPKYFKKGFPYIVDVEPALELLTFFEIYMVKYGYKKFNIPTLDFKSIKLPISSLDGVDGTIETTLYDDDYALIKFDQIHELHNLLMVITQRVFKQFNISINEVDDFIMTTQNIHKKCNENYCDDKALKEYEKELREDYDDFHKRFSPIIKKILNNYEKLYEKHN